MRHHSAVRVQILDDVDIPLWGILIDFPKEPDFQLDSSDIQALRIPAVGWLRSTGDVST